MNFVEFAAVKYMNTKNAQNAISWYLPYANAVRTYKKFNHISTSKIVSQIIEQDGVVTT